jgi:hypothetical protein
MPDPGAQRAGAAAAEAAGVESAGGMEGGGAAGAASLADALADALAIGMYDQYDPGAVAAQDLIAQGGAYSPGEQERMDAAAAAEQARQ